MRPRISHRKLVARSTNFRADRVLSTPERKLKRRVIEQSFLRVLVHNHISHRSGQDIKAEVWARYGTPSTVLSLEDKKTSFYNLLKTSIKSIQKAQTVNVQASVAA